MKKILLLSVALVLGLSLVFSQSPQDEGIKFEKGNFTQILAKAKKENKLVFIDAYASWCGPCKRMDAEVFPQKKVGDYFNATFINARFDVDKGEGFKIAQRYNVNRYPTFLIVDGDGVLKGTLIGGSPADDFILRVKQLVEKSK